MIAFLTIAAALALGFLAGYYSALTQIADKAEGAIDPRQKLEALYLKSQDLQK